MLDPRRSITRDKDALETSYLKTFGITAAIAFGGIKLVNRYANQRTVLLDAISNARAKYEKTAPIFRGDPYSIRPDKIDMDSIDFDESIDRPHPMDDWEDIFASDIDAYERIEDGDLFKRFGTDIEETLQNLETINRQIRPLTPEELGEQMATRDVSVALNRVAKEYPELTAILDTAGVSAHESSYHSMWLRKVDTVGTNYRLHVTNGTRTDIIELPKFSSGIVNWRGSNYKPRPAAQLKSGMITLNSFGLNVMSRLKESVKFLGAKNRANPTAQLKSMVDNVVSINLGKFVDNGHIIKHLLTTEFLFEGLAETFDKPSIGKEEILTKLPGMLERAEILVRYSGRKGIVPIGEHGSIRSISELSAMKFAGISEIPFGIWPFTSWSKVSQARANFIAGRVLDKPMKRREIAAKLGPTSMDVVDFLSKNMKQSIPGKMTNVGFYTGPDKIRGLGKGGALWISRFIGNLDGSLSDTLNVSAYSGVRKRRVSVPLYNIAGSSMNDLRAGVNEETKRLIDEWVRRGEGDIVLKKGTWLGGKGGKDSVHVDNDARVTGIRFDKGYIDISTEEEIPIHQGTKLDQGKMMIQRNIMWNQVQKNFSEFTTDGKLLGLILSQGVGAELGTELLTSGSTVSKYAGGALGWGVIQKVMSDLIQLKKAEIAKQSGKLTHEKMYRLLKRESGRLKEILRTTLGNNINEIVEGVSISPDTFEPLVILKPRQKVPDNVSVRTSDAAFAKIIDIEHAVHMAQDRGDWRELNDFEKRLSKHFKGVGTPYKLIVDVPPKVKDYLKLAEVGYEPSFIRQIARDGDKISADMIYFSVRTPEMVHQVSSYEYKSFASLARSRTGFAGGFKVTLDHIENAQAAGLKHYVKYLHLLLDHNVDYIRDKMFVTEARMFERLHTKMPSGNLVEMKGVKTITAKDFGGLTERLAQYKHSEEALKAAGRWKIIEKELSGLQGMVDNDAYADLINSRMLSFDDVRNTNLAGMGRYSVDVTERSLVHELVQLVNTAGKDEAVYIELPMTLQMGEDKRVKYVPIDKFDKADMFELEAMRLPEGIDMGEKMSRKFYTGSEYYTNRMQFLKQIAIVTEDLKHIHGDKVKRRGLEVELTRAVNAYFDNLKRMTKGKHAGMRSAMFNYKAPFSTKGIINSLSSGDVGDRKIQGMQGIPTDSLYMHEDDIAKLITGGKVKSLKQARAMVAYSDKLRKVEDSLKGMNPEYLDEIKSREMLDMVESTGKALSRIDYNAYSKGVATTIEDITTESKFLARTLSAKGKVFSEAEGTTLLGLTKRIHALMDQTIVEAKAGNMSANVGAIHRYTVDTIEKMKAGKLTLHGRLQGSPEISQLSGDHLKLKVVQSNEFSQKVINQKVVQHVKNQTRFFDKFKGHMYVAEEMALAISRDFDADPMSFIMTSLDVMQLESDKTESFFSLMKEAGIFGKSSNKATMELFHNLTEETLVENILSRLAVAEWGNKESVLETLRPASISAITTMHELRDNIEDNRVRFKQLKSYITRSLEETYGPDGLKQLAEAYNIPVTNTDRIADKVLSKVRKIRGKGIEFEDLRIVEGILDTPGDVVKKEKVTRQKLVDYTKFAKEFPDKLSEKLGGKYTDDELTVRNAIMEENKSIHKRYQDYMINESERFRLIKDQTPTAYNISKALSSLFYGYVKEGEQQEFLTLLADKVIAQNTISAKHGNPQVLGDIVKTLRDLASVNDLVLDKTLDNLARGNMKINLQTNEKNEMKRLGFKIEDVDLDMYERYLDTRETYFTELTHVHTEAINEVTIKHGRLLTSEKLSEKYKQAVSSRVDSIKHLREYGALPELYYDDMVVGNELRIAQEAKKNAKEFRRIAKMDLNEKVLKDRWTSLARTLKEYSQEHRVSVFDDPALKAFRSFEGKEVNIHDMMIGMLTDKGKHLRKDVVDHTITARNTLESWVARMGAIISGSHHANISIGPVSDVDRSQRLQMMASKEVRNIQRMYSERIAEESTVFRTGSMFDTIKRYTAKATGGVAEDAMLTKASRLRGSGLLLGLMAGTILGQAVNQIVSGYPVPDLKGTVGLGGEYYEDKGSIIGREMEIMLKPRPPRITPNYNSQATLTRDAGSMQDMSAAYGSSFSVQQLGSSFKGSIIQ